MHFFETIRKKCESVIIVLMRVCDGSFFVRVTLRCKGGEYIVLHNTCISNTAINCEGGLNNFINVGSGICVNDDGKSSSNYSRNYVDRVDCESACMRAEHCMAYSFYNTNLRFFFFKYKMKSFHVYGFSFILNYRI